MQPTQGQTVSPKLIRSRVGAHLICKHCKAEFRVPSYRKDTAKFCSIYCQNHGQHARKSRTCEGCQQEYTTSKSREGQRFCSRECRNSTRRSERERRRRGSLVGNAKYNKLSLRKMRDLIMTSGLGQCIACGYGEHSFCIDLHHIDHNPDNNTPENLAVLCAICHRKYHRGVLAEQIRGVDASKLKT